jgi:hypothetical protein
MLQGPTKTDCPDGCGLFGKLTTGGFVKGCPGAASTRSQHSLRGNKSQRKVARRLGVTLYGLGPGAEQNWRACWRTEVKDDQRSRSIDTFYRSTKAQSDKDKGLGDIRPFVPIAVHDGREYAVIPMEQMDNALIAWAERPPRG